MSLHPTVESLLIQLDDTMPPLRVNKLVKQNLKRMAAKNGDKFSAFVRKELTKIAMVKR